MKPRRFLSSSLRLFVTPSLLTLALLLAACESQENVTKYKPFFTGIGDAEFSGQTPVNPMGGRVDPSRAGAAQETIIENPDGTRTYRAFAPVQVFAHVEALLDEDTPEADKALLDQLIDEKTKDHYRKNNVDPAEYITYLHANRKELAKTFARMPMGEHSPTVIVKQPGDRQWAIELTGQAARDLKFREVWVRQDMGLWRLEWLK